MLSARQRHKRYATPGRAAPRRRPGDRASTPVNSGVATVRAGVGGSHPLTRGDENAHLYDYECNIKEAFDSIVPTLKMISALQHEPNFETSAQRIARQHLGFELPLALL